MIAILKASKIRDERIQLAAVDSDLGSLALRVTKSGRDPHEIIIVHAGNDLTGRWMNDAQRSEIGNIEKISASDGEGRRDGFASGIEFLIRCVDGFSGALQEWEIIMALGDYVHVRIKSGFELMCNGGQREA